MVDFVSVQDGDWNDPNTWDQGSGFPDGSDDTASIGHDVKYNVNSGGATNCGAVTITSGGLLYYRTDAAVTTRLSLEGNLTVQSGAELRMGNTGTPIPDDSTAILEFNCSTDGQYGLIVDGTGWFYSHGKVKSSFHKLASDIAVNGTSLTLAETPTGWEDNDEIVLTPTSRTYTEWEVVNVNGAPSGTTVNFDGGGGVGGGAAYAHSGTSPAQGEVGNYTRNVKVRSIGAAPSYVRGNIGAGGFVCYYTEFSELGCSTSYLWGLTIYRKSGTGQKLIGCSSRGWTGADKGYYGLYVYVTPGTIEINDCLVYGNWRYAFYTAVGTGVTFDNICAGGTFALYGWTHDRAGVFVSMGDIYLSGCASTGARFNGSPNKMGTHTGILESHSNSGTGIYFINIYGSIFDTLKAWRNNHASYGGIYDLPWDSVVGSVIAFGNNNTNIHFASAGNVRVGSMTLNGDTTFTTNYGLRMSGQIYIRRNIIINDLDAGTASGILTAHAVSDLRGDAAQSQHPILLVNPALASPTPFGAPWNSYQVYDTPSFVCLNLADVANDNVGLSGNLDYGTSTHYGITPYGGNGEALIIHPKHGYYISRFQFSIPCKSGQALNLSFKASQSDAGAFYISATGSGINYAKTALNPGTYDGTDDGWNDESHNLGTPTSDGWVQVWIWVNTPGDLYIDEVVTTGSNTNNMILDENMWGNLGLNTYMHEGAAAGGDRRSGLLTGSRLN